MSFLELLGWGSLVVIILQGLLWLYYCLTDNAGWVDVGWAYGLGILALFYAVNSPEGSVVYRSLVALMGGVWSLRLGTYLLFRVGKEKEDGRYTQMKKNWKTNLKIKFFLFYQFQALLDIFLSLPFLLAVQNKESQASWITWVALVLWFVSILGESLSDYQLSVFRQNPSNHGQTCRQGLWKYSRHPNYFFEWLIWVAFFLLALGSPWGFISILCPILMLYFLMRVTGIPATEEQSLRSRPEDYARYQKETSMFIPWFPKKIEGS